MAWRSRCWLPRDRAAVKPSARSFDSAAHATLIRKILGSEKPAFNTDQSLAEERAERALGGRSHWVSTSTRAAFGSCWSMNLSPPACGIWSETNQWCCSPTRSSKPNWSCWRSVWLWKFHRARRHGSAASWRAFAEWNLFSIDLCRTIWPGSFGSRCWVPPSTAARRIASTSPLWEHSLLPRLLTNGGRRAVAARAIGFGVLLPRWTRQKVGCSVLPHFPQMGDSWRIEFAREGVSHRF